MGGFRHSSWRLHALPTQAINRTALPLIVNAARINIILISNRKDINATFVPASMPIRLPVSSRIIKSGSFKRQMQQGKWVILHHTNFVNMHNWTLVHHTFHILSKPECIGSFGYMAVWIQALAEGMEMRGRTLNIHSN